MNDLLELWHTQNRINLYLLHNLPTGGLEAIPVGGDMRVGQMIAHISDLRLRWVQESEPDLTEQLPWFERQPKLAINTAQLESALNQSGAAVKTLIQRRNQAGRGVDCFPSSLTSFLGYLISHESYHWGEIGLALTQSNRPLPPDVALGIWRGWWDREVSLNDIRNGND